MNRAEDCGAVGRTGKCCKAKGHTGSHLRPGLTWDEWGAICGASGNYGAMQEPLACAYPADHDGPHAWESLPTFVDGKPVAL